MHQPNLYANYDSVSGHRYHVFTGHIWKTGVILVFRARILRNPRGLDRSRHCLIVGEYCNKRADIQEIDCAVLVDVCFELKAIIGK